MSARSRRLRVEIHVALASTCVARNIEELVVHVFSPVLILHKRPYLNIIEIRVNTEHLVELV